MFYEKWIYNPSQITGDSSFPMKQRITRKVQFLFFRSFLLILTKFLLWEEDWTLGWNLLHLSKKKRRELKKKPFNTKFETHEKIRKVVIKSNKL